jgi:hypothetical protein
MRLIELEVGTWFRSAFWSENAVALLVEEPRAEHGLASIWVHNKHPSVRRPSSMRSRLASDREMQSDEWVVVERPDWVTDTGGSG